MYKLTQIKNFHDEIELETSDGKSEILEINLKIDPVCIKNYRELQLQIIELQQQNKISPGNAEIIEKIGAAIVNTFSLLLGTENTEKILAFYAGNYVDMMTGLYPYLETVIVPEFQKAAKQRKKELSRGFKGR